MSLASPPMSPASEASPEGTQAHVTAEHHIEEKQPPKISPNPRKSTITRLLKSLPPWAMKIKDRQQQKLLFRCWIASWLTVLVLLPEKSLEILGQAGFFGGVATSSSRASGGDITQAEFTRSAYHGVFLDSRSTAVFAVFLATGTFSLGFLRAKKPNFAVPSVFATMFLNVLCSYGPLFPTPQYSLANSFVVSTAYYVAIGMVAIIFVYPQTLNHEWISGAVKLLDGVKEFIVLQEEVLTVELDEFEMDPMSENLLNRMHGKADSLDARFLASGLMAFLTLLVASVNTRRRDARSGADTPISKSMPRDDSLHTTNTFRLIYTRRLAAQHEAHQRLRVQDLMPTLRSTTEDLRKACLDAAKAASHALMVINTQRYKRKLPWLLGKLRKVEEEEVVDVATALKNLRAVIATYKQTNRFELLQPFSSLIDSDKASPLVDKHGHPPFSLRTLFLCFVFQSNLLWAADSLKSLLVLLLDVEKKRQEGRLWWPTHLSRVFAFILRGSGTSPLDSAWSPLDSPPAEEDGHEFFEHGYRELKWSFLDGRLALRSLTKSPTSLEKDPDSRPPRHFGQRVCHAIHLARLWLRSPETIFGLKYMTISVLLWLPGVFKSSAWFAYTERGLWALFMGQLTMALYISDQVQAIKGRIFGTLQGGLIGMVAWYVGNGGGDHVNPYGLAASSGLFLIPVVFNRLFNPYPIDSLVCGITAMLVIGYSWTNAHLDPLGNPGVGWNVAWRRTICVFIGCSGALVLMLLPPQSCRRDVRLSTAATLEDISGLYAGLLSRWLGDIERPESRVAVERTDSITMMLDYKAAEPIGQNKSLASFERWAPVFRSRLIKVSARLRALQSQTEGAKWEGNLRGDWPFDKYARLVLVQSRMVMNLVQLSASLGALNPAWRRTLLHKTPVLNPNLVTDTMSAFAIFAMSLRTGRAISEVLPRSLVDRVYYHQALTAESDDESDEGENDETRLRASVAFTRNTKTTHHHHDILTKDTFLSEEWAFYATGLAGAFQILFALDETRGLCADLCGEVPLRGFEDWRREFELRQLGELV
ncbi:hypothetical protein FRB96_005100 [Tulasnella sp. 330]|nr:hypothetical protein FRB96_005100 [Tulasnella sp. 330]